MRVARQRESWPDSGVAERPPHSWTIAPVIGWFALFLVIGLIVFDRGLSALADRLTASRESSTTAPTAGPVFTAKPAVVADADVEPAIAPPAPTGDRAKVGALEDSCIEGSATSCKRWGMDGFYQALTATKGGKLGRPVRISWYGDSVIATDAIPARLRARMQSTFGDGGAGFVHVAAPHRFCHHEGVDRTSSGFTPYAISTTAISDHWYGPGASTVESYGGRATYKLAHAASELTLFYIAQPKGGSVTMRSAGSEVLAVDTAADVKASAAKQAKLDAPTTKFELQATGKVRLFGIAFENRTGAVVDNLGIVSVNVKSFSNYDLAHFQQELARRGADLVMIMIGANEAAWLSPGDADTKLYKARYEEVLKAIRKGRPDGSCLVVSPTDQAESKDGGYPSRRVMPVLVEAQRQAAQSAGCGFYSSYDWMGGKGSAAKWFRAGLVGSDFQHLSHKGAEKFADGIYDALMAGLQRRQGP